MAGADLWHVGTAVYLFILLAMLVVVVRLQSQFGTAHGALETAAVEKREVLERPDPVHLIHCLVAPKTGALVEVHAIHRATPRHQLHLQRAERTVTTMFLPCFFLGTGPASQPRQAWQQVPLPPAATRLSAMWKRECRSRETSEVPLSADALTSAAVAS